MVWWQTQATLSQDCRTLKRCGDDCKKLTFQHFDSHPGDVIIPKTISCCFNNLSKSSRSKYCTWGRGCFCDKVFNVVSFVGHCRIPIMSTMYQVVAYLWETPTCSHMVAGQGQQMYSCFHQCFQWSSSGSRILVSEKSETQWGKLQLIPEGGASLSSTFAKHTCLYLYTTTNSSSRRTAAIATAQIRGAVKSVLGPSEEKYKNIKQEVVLRTWRPLQTELTRLKDLTGHSHMVNGYTFHSDFISRRQQEGFSHLLNLLIPLRGHVILGHLISGNISAPTGTKVQMETTL